MVDALADQFVESGAPNYIEMQFHSEATGPLLFTLQRVNGKTPHQLRAEAEKERAGLAEKLAAANRAVDEAYQRGYATGQEEIETERDELRAKLEAAEKSDAESIAMYRKARDERDALRARIEEREKQKPICITTKAYLAALENEATRYIVGRDPVFSTYGENDVPLYLAAGARAAPADEYAGWYCAHCERGVDASEVTYHEQHQACGRVITDDRPPKASVSVPEKVEVREDKEEEMFSRGSYNEGYDNGWNDCIDAMLAAARERRTSHDM